MIFQNTMNFLNGLTLKRLFLLFISIGIIIQIPLILNPGYFSHDELQWAARADVLSLNEIKWLSWLSFEEFQFRPLTFNLWLFLSHFLFNHPYFFHFLIIIWGTVNAAMLIPIMQHYKLPVMQSLVGALVFILSPYAVFVHGWVATMADMLVLSLLLLSVLTVLKFSNIAIISCIVAIFTTLSLLSKESAIVFPAVFFLLWMFDGRKKRWLISTIITAIIAMLYLWIRLPVLMQQPENTHYSMSILNAPVRWLEYHFYWIMLNTKEPQNTLPSGFHSSPLVAGILLIAFLLVIWRANKKLAFAFLAGGVICLLPVLPISSSYAQYGYIFAACSVFIISGIWQDAGRWQRKYIMLLIFLICSHGILVMKMMWRVGNIQSVFSPSLAEISNQYDKQERIFLKLSNHSDIWIYKRFTHDISSYNGKYVGDRFSIIVNDDLNEGHADFLILEDGRLKKL